MIITPKPIEFKRGTTFTYLVMIPKDIGNVVDKQWTTYSSMRKLKNNTSLGHIAFLESKWEPEDQESTYNSLTISANDTREWPLGLVELDVMLKANDGTIYASDKVIFDIKDTVSH